jgi:site-specific recombinase XerD
VLLIDETQEMVTPCLNAIRLLSSSKFDSQCLLTTVLSGDIRLPERFRSASLVSLGSRVRLRMMIEPYDPKVLLDYLKHSLQQAGASHLMTESLMETLSEHASGNLRLLNTMSLGLRVGEVHDLDLECIDFKNRKITVMGKGRKLRTLHVNDELIEIVSQYLAVRDKFLNNWLSKALFISKKGNRLAIRTMENNFKKILLQAALNIPFSVTCHTLRHSLASEPI